jgi:hypothetical protein
MELQSGLTYIFKYKDGSFQVNSTNNESSTSTTNNEKVDQKSNTSTINKDLKFTATVIDVLINHDGYRTLRVENQIIENKKIPGMVTMPYDWIESAVLLNELTK